jgi:hypothetical protein
MFVLYYKMFWVFRYIAFVMYLDTHDQNNISENFKMSYNLE